MLTVLQPPAGLEDQRADSVASLSGSLLVNYGLSSLVLYTTGETFGTVLSMEDLLSGWSIAVGPGGYFLVADGAGNTVWVLSVTGKVLARVEIDRPMDMTLSPDNRRLYIGNNAGEITVLE